VPELDLILGGHDHFFFYKTGKGNVTIKSGTDFRELTFNKVKYFKNNLNVMDDLNEKRIKCFSEKLSEKDYFSMIDKQEHSFSVETQLIRVHKSLPEDELIKEFANFINEKTHEKFKIVIGRIATRIDAQFLCVRRNSLPISNFVTDLLRIYMNTDCAILNSGSLRIDSYINEGEITYMIILIKLFRYEILRRLLPGNYNVVRLKAKGAQILKALENGVSKFPALEGRFPMVTKIHNFFRFQE
jgi:5'-nucleotidase